MVDFSAPVLEEIDVADGSADEIGFSFGGLVKSIGKAAKSVGQAASSVVKSPILQVSVGVLAVAFPAVGIPAAAAIATANAALKAAATGASAAIDLNAKLSALKARASTGDAAAATAVNAMQVALASKKAQALGMTVLRPVALATGSFSTTPKPLAAASTQSSVPTSLYRPTQSPAAYATQLAAGGSPLGRQVLTAVSAGKSVAVPDGLAVIPGSAPTRPKKLWLGRAPAGTKARALPGAHVVTKSGFVFSGQSVFAA